MNLSFPKKRVFALPIKLGVRVVKQTVLKMTVTIGSATRLKNGKELGNTQVHIVPEQHAQRDPVHAHYCSSNDRP